jgi:hypothetical protein
MEAIYHPFNHNAKAEAPTKWCEEIVAARMIEGCKVVAAITVGNRSPSNGWPQILRDFSDRIHYADEARKEVWDSWCRVKPQYDAATVKRAEDAMHWPAQFLRHDSEAATIVLAWATAKAANKPVGASFKRRGIAESTARRKRLAALKAISKGLNAAGVRVLEAQVLLA